MILSFRQLRWATSKRALWACVAIRQYDVAFQLNLNRTDARSANQTERRFLGHQESRRHRRAQFRETQLDDIVAFPIVILARAKDHKRDTIRAHSLGVQNKTCE